MTSDLDTRTVTLVIADGDGAALGALPPFEVGTPWWPDVGPVVAAARDRFRVDLVVLRLLGVVGGGEMRGGSVTYLAEPDGELPGDVPLHPVPDGLALGDEPLRARWARPGGPREILRWADAALASIGRPRTGPAEPIKTWNLSCVFRLPAEGGDVWCKTVPPFLAPEGEVVRLVAEHDPDLLPPMLASEPSLGTALLDDAGSDARWDASEDELHRMVRDLVRIQARWVGHTNPLLAAGVPDVRAGAFVRDARALLARPDVRATCDARDLDTLDTFAGGLASAFEDLAACGLPDTLVHGDFHPGNWHAIDGRLVLLDWGDSVVGHPLLDTSAFLTGIPDRALVARVLETWADAWRAAGFDADVVRAVDLIAPIASLRRAIVYRRFLDRIEPSERVYHEPDVPRWLAATAETLRH